MELLVPDPHASVQNVELDRAEPEHRLERYLSPGAAAAYHQHAREELFGGERHGHDAVQAIVEWVELGFQVPPPRVSYHGHPGPLTASPAEALEQPMPD